MDSWVGGGVYQQHGELRKIALEMALNRFESESGDGDDILALAENFYEFLTSRNATGDSKDDQT